MNKVSRWKEVIDPKELYEDFWSVISTLLNSILFILVGVSITSITNISSLLVLIPMVIILNLVARAFGVWAPMSFFKKAKMPGKYNLNELTVLLSWTALKGGIALAFMLSVKNVLLEEHYLILLNCTIITILFTTIIQGLTTDKVYSFIERKREKRIEEIS